MQIMSFWALLFWIEIEMVTYFKIFYSGGPGLNNHFLECTLIVLEAFARHQKVEVDHK